MEKRKIGNTGLEIAPLALGGNVFGWTADEQASYHVLDAFTDAGLNLVDTADVYSRWYPGHKGGESETIIGKWLHKSGKRDKILIATKVGSDMGNGKKGLAKKYILEAAEASLKRLQTDHIDLYQSHYDDMGTPMEETLEAYMQLIKDGKVIAIGASNFTPERLVQSLQVSADKDMPAYQCLQPQYNLYDREQYEKKYETICRERNLGVICYYALASGFLTGKYRSERDLNKSQRGHGVQKYLNDRGYRILKALDEVANEYSSTPAAVSLAWLLTRPCITAPIASATNAHQMLELAKAIEITLDSTAIEKLNHASN